MRTGGRLTSWLTVFALALAGCGGDGGSDSDEEEAKRVAQAYVDALADGDAAAACQQMRDDPICVKRTQEEFQQGRTLGADFGRVETVIVDGSAARANFSSGGFLVLSERDDRWKIGAPASQASDLGAPKPPKTVRCTPKQEEKIRKQWDELSTQQREELGLPLDGPLFCEE